MHHVMLTHFNASAILFLFESLLSCPSMFFFQSNLRRAAYHVSYILELSGLTGKLEGKNVTIWHASTICQLSEDFANTHTHKEKTTMKGDITKN